MKKIKLEWIVLGLLVISIIWLVGIYNRMVTKEEMVNKQWANVDNVYQRKYDLIPNLVAVAQEYADFEKEVLTEVVEKRSTAASIKIDPSNPESMAQFEAAQRQLSGSLSRLLVTFERYPDLKASATYLELNAELAGSENRISTERRKTNEAVADFNRYIRRFPNSFIARFGGFERMELFKAEEAATGGKVDVKDLFEKDETEK